jgi:hypothetical protein
MRKHVSILTILFCLTIPVGLTGGYFHLTVRFDRINGLVERDRVFFEKEAVGIVENITYTENGQFYVNLAIEKKISPSLTTRARIIVTDDIKIAGKKAITIIQTRTGGRPLADGAIVDGSDRYAAYFEDMKYDLEEGLALLKKELDNFSKDLQKLPESQRFQALTEELKRIADSLKTAGEETKETIRKELLPLLRQEMEKLREYLRKHGREEEMEPLDNEMKKITHI